MTAGSAPAPSEIERFLAEDKEKVEKLKVIFGDWWRHYAVPYEFRWTLYCEFGHCPYCGGDLGPISDAGGQNVAPDGRVANLDHMDPISRGGEESIRNAVYACAACNVAKRNRLFSQWIENLPAERQARCREIYISKHGTVPEAFRPGRPLARLTSPRIELQFDIEVLRVLFPKPLVDGPPTRLPMH